MEEGGCSSVSKSIRGPLLMREVSLGDLPVSSNSSNYERMKMLEREILILLLLL